MGGDDLGDDDADYLNVSVQEDDDGALVTAKDHSAAIQDEKESSTTNDNKKRQLNGDHDKEAPDATTKKSKKSHNVLLETSRHLLTLQREEQALFLSTALQHYTQLRGNNDNNNEEESDIPKLPSPTRWAHFLVQPKESNTTFLDRLLSVMSKKRLKKQARNSTQQGHPSIVIICQSARRAVALLQECAPLGVKAAKLFPKQATVAQQATELQSTSVGLAVGTPHRLLALLDTGALQLSAAQLIVLDAAPCPPKHYTVCTLPDTAPDCMQLLAQHVLPALQRQGKQLKLAFL
eukprot:CAMPEP_0172444102 /NCGR_PEP_ID=MMETSP1065-20121228/4214_1 /TAXON_ID=265537 /ORGANISM="Amphiprora paludosa, Strain CCMP125" /LENGTH=291 /DNA_ID=CAMNT_0013194521 /DNA_START=94 /DNA_END=969 /DNA_ORIENTATION=+